MKHDRTLLISCSLVLIFEFGARLLFPAQEIESSGLRLLRLPDAWRLLRRIYAGGYQVHVLTEAHWEDWVANPFPEPAKASPWQKEALALVNDIQIAEKEHDALLEARGAGGASPKPTPNAPNVPEDA